MVLQEACLNCVNTELLGPSSELHALLDHQLYFKRKKKKSYRSMH